MKETIMTRALLLAACLALAGCISLPMKNNSEPPSIYTLHAPPAGKLVQRAGQSVVMVPKPELPAGFQTERIALYLENGHRLDYYADAKWSSSLDELLQNFLIQQMQQKLSGTAVGTAELAASARYRLAVKFADMEPIYADAADKPPQLAVAMTVTVISLPSQKVQTQFKVQRTAAASANTLTAVTTGLESLLRSLTDEALEKARPYLGQAKAAPPTG